MQTFHESTTQLSALTCPKRRPNVPGLAVGDIVFSRHGRRMRVEATDELVITRTAADSGKATGPYCALQALDDKNVRVIWPRAWYTKPGETLQLDLADAQ